MTRANGVIVGHSYQNDVSPPLRQMPVVPSRPRLEREASANPGTGLRHDNAPDGARQTKAFAPRMPTPVLNFNGIPYPGVNCACFPPDTNGEVGATQYVQMVNQGIQVFDKTTGASVLGPIDIATIWSSFGGACEVFGFGDPGPTNSTVDIKFGSQFETGRSGDCCTPVSHDRGVAGLDPYPVR